MIKVYTDRSKFNTDRMLVQHEGYFSAHRGTEMLDEEDKRIIFNIDGATVLDNCMIDGKFGITSLENISSSAKTVLNVKDLISKGISRPISIISCGRTAIKELIKVLKPYENDDTREIILYTVVTSYVIKDPIRIIVNGERIANGFNELEEWH